MKKKPGPKPKPADKKAQQKNYSYLPEHADFLDTLDESPGAFLRKLINNSPEYQSYHQSYLKELKSTLNNGVKAVNARKTRSKVFPGH